MNNNQRLEVVKISNWDESSKKLKEQFSQLTDVDLKYEVGRENDLLNRLEKKMNKKRSEVIDLINKYEKQSKV
ncbi:MULTISPECIES: hypothetical protein [Myroides]|uniref:General stress protein CsbD n=1 Tax=Myroides odoratus TaxID=256 RepID=A0A378RKI6_MYROD|nr:MULTISPECIES: hypothetical protein [Myroides]MDH6600356.1 lysyl-tRNA synthetase class II [Myroides gitamensis]EHQ44227.1 hypothetical protein Myrod_3421 [Myroides odoratus DSM 2801]EKB05879.1 hypothetical protein HMPREF9716_02672 [Myroides odoratus CIP 103059]MCS4238709.1 lysyl-tRNA synthetase class II [Myroides odoratus]QQU01511.1 hypothetical protein I6I88_07155 [Myroides odoratus]